MVEPTPSPAERSPREQPQSRILGAIVVGLLSIVVPLIIGAAILIATSYDSEAGVLIKRQSTNFTSISHAGKLWALEFSHVLRLTKTTPPYIPRVKQIDLATGAESESEVRLPRSDFGVFRQVRGDLYYITQTAIFRLEGKNFRNIGPVARANAWLVQRTLFDWEGRLTSFSQSQDGSYRLVHLDSGRWIDGRRVVLPRPDQLWKWDEEKSQFSLTFPTSVDNPKNSNGWKNVSVVDHQGIPHLLFQALRFCAFRKGIEFADHEDDEAIPSAQAPENSPHTASQWQPFVVSNEDSPTFASHMVSFGDRLLFLSYLNSGLDLLQNADGVWTRISYKPSAADRQLLIIADESLSDPIFIIHDGVWGSTSYHRITKSSVEPPYLTIPDRTAAYVFSRLLGGAAIAALWLLHVAILFRGANWLLKRQGPTTIEFGNQRATLAPLGRRAVATLIDVILLVVSTFLVLMLSLYGLGSLMFSSQLFASVFLRVDEQFQSMLYDFEQIMQAVFSGPLSLTPALPRFSSPDVVLVLVLLVLPTAVLKTWIEGQIGVTPGKWLMGLRTIRSTLRPCGVARAIVKNLAYAVDLPFLLTPLPAFFSIVFSDHNQTLGDRLADTVVIRSHTLTKIPIGPENDSATT